MTYMGSEATRVVLREARTDTKDRLRGREVHFMCRTPTNKLLLTAVILDSITSHRNNKIVPTGGDVWFRSNAFGYRNMDSPLVQQARPDVFEPKVVGLYRRLFQV